MGMNESSERKRYDFAKKGKSIDYNWSIIQSDEMIINLGVCQLEKFIYIPQLKSGFGTMER